MTIRFSLCISLLSVVSHLSAAQPLDVVINEIAWSGTAADANDEWLELANNTTSTVDLTGWRLRATDGAPSIGLTGSVAAGGFFLLERTSDDTVSDVAADQIYSGALSNGPPGEGFQLLDTSSQTIDAVLSSTGGWQAGTASPDYRSMERADPRVAGAYSGNWKANNTTIRNGRDADGEPLNATPRAANSALGSGLIEHCGNGADDDADGRADCGDDSCASYCPPGASADALTVDDRRNPFSPRDPDPAFQSSLVFFQTAPEVVKTIRVCDVRGNTVRTLVNSDQGPSGANLAGMTQGSVPWDGRDDDGHVLPMGIYIVFLEGVDPGNGRRVRGKDTVVIGR